MNKNKINTLDLRHPEVLKGMASFLDIIHFYSKAVINSRTEQDVFDVLVNEITPKLDLVDCVIYKVDKRNKSIFQVAAYGHKNDKGAIKNRLTLSFGEGLAGIAAETGESILVKDIATDDRYVKDMISAGSEIEIPIKMNEEVYAVISSEHPDKDFYNEYHVKLFEILASITVGTLVKIHENNELAEVKSKLEGILKQKSSDLDRAIEAVSSQYSELKYQHEKRTTLIQEVHHRVNNNLQIISSILKMYLNRPENNGPELQEIHNRVQAMALIHQNIYKSMEMNLVDVTSYIRDLMNYLKSLNNDIYISFQESIKFDHINLNTLVPLGLFITEIIQLWMERSGKNTEEIHFQIIITDCDEGYKYRMRISDNLKMPVFQDVNLNTEPSLTAVLINALVEQLEGKMSLDHEKTNSLTMCFNPID